MSRQGNVEFWYKTLEQGFANGDPSFYAILVALLVGIITLFVVFIRLGKKNNRRGILMMGACDGGKTLMFSRLTANKYVETYTSIKENTGNYELTGDKTGTLRMIDLPGHERLRSQYFDQYKASARGIMFVVDSASLQKDIKDVAECLYTILTDGFVSSAAVPILIACNKQDLTLAKGAKVVQKQLEKEMNTLRVTRSAALEGTSDTGNNNTFLGRRDRDFQFADLKPFTVDFVECSARGSNGTDGDGELNQVIDWLQKIA
ncbi:signal recognition particle receptor subunit beta-like [Lingula anatina]|uniref:Signal recognition particle receptor subunit beta n=1 Tax=Lingula anatina TaxID=7574 RepID=A0A1S3KE65_LINAN|nr:signal recognition particle receptor subunit beta-like [Lingula anatina]|eukprot:XP_013420918.1 signal recognition particle receptor subunit beta-like [Lingula anatina]